jgi:hypoxanthine phosphoribosyltransferase
VILPEKKTSPNFVHPSEEVFSRILDFYGIQWEYEPRTFALETDEDGNVTEAFTPDFYLTEQDLYVELTTLRPQLSTKKNRKLKRLQERYPEVNIKLFKRRELRNLMIKYGLMDEAEMIAGTDAQENNNNE